MENILSLSSRTTFLIGLALFVFSFFVSIPFDNAAPDDFLAPVAQAIAHLVSNGIFYFGVGLLVIAAIKFIYALVVDGY